MKILFYEMSKLIQGGRNVFHETTSHVLPVAIIPQVSVMTIQNGRVYVTYRIMGAHFVEVKETGWEVAYECIEHRREPVPA